MWTSSARPGAGIREPLETQVSTKGVPAIFIITPPLRTDEASNTTIYIRKIYIYVSNIYLYINSYQSNLVSLLYMYHYIGRRPEQYINNWLTSGFSETAEI